MGPNPPAAPTQKDPYARGPAPGYYYAPPPMPVPMTPVQPPAKPTWLGRWGLGLSILAMILPIAAVVVGNAAAARGGTAGPAFGLFTLLALVFAILGVVFSAVGMSHRYTRRGMAIAGLVVGIIALTPLFLGVLAGIALFATG